MSSVDDISVPSESPEPLVDAYTMACRSVFGCGAVSDAFGASLEFINPDQMFDRYPLIASTLSFSKFPSRDDRFTDDTQMTLWAAEALSLQELRLSSMPSVLWDYWKLWRRTQYEDFTPPSTGPLPQVPSRSSYESYLWWDERAWGPRAPGNTCLSALSEPFWGTSLQPLNNSLGCGAVMRAAVFGLWATSFDEAFTAGEVQAALTHGHPRAASSAGATAALAYAGINGSSWQAALDDVVGHLTDSHLSQLLRAACHPLSVSSLHEACTLSESLVELYGAGWVSDEALAVAVAATSTALAFLEHEFTPIAGETSDVLLSGRFTQEAFDQAFEIGLRLASWHSGDSDSTAAVYGNLWGAFTSHIPTRSCFAMDLVYSSADRFARALS